MSSSKNGPFKKWQCGDPYQYPIVEDGDHWQKLLEPKFEEDRMQCETWKEEVQNLLIFAGLFSAVVSAFAVVSYPSLQPNQNEIMIMLLARIATQLDNPLNNSSSGSLTWNASNPSTLSTPTPASSIRVNIFWFISLVLSLTTALIGIVSLQWLREHQQYPNSLTPKQKFALFGMRAEGLVAWYVPQIFSSLPVLLQVSLMLFFLGLVEFLLAASVTVAVPVIFLVSMTFACHVFTTVSPGLQMFIFYLPLVRARRVPIQVPYKSSQSRLFRQLLALSKTSFTFFAHLNYALFHVLPSLVYPLIRRPNNAHKLDVDRQDFSIMEGRTIIHEMLDTSISSSWLAFDKKWLELRDGYAQGIFAKRWWALRISLSMSDFSAPIYDLVNTMVNIIGCYGPQLSTQANLSLSYHCVQDMTLDNKCPAPYLQELLRQNDVDLKNPSSTFSSLLWFDSVSTEFRADETRFIFLSQFHDLPPSFFQHFTELHVRIANYLYPKEARKCVPGRKFPSYPFKAFWYQYTSGKFSTSEDAAISEQFSAFIGTFLEVMEQPDVHVNEVPFLTPSYGGSISPYFRFAIWKQAPEGASASLRLLSRRTQDCMKGGVSENTDSLFCVSSYYLYLLLQWGCWRGFELNPEDYDNHPSVGPFLALLRQYRESRGSPDAGLWKRLGIPDPYDQRPERSGFVGFWELLDRQRTGGILKEGGLHCANLLQYSLQDPGDRVPVASISEVPTAEEPISRPKPSSQQRTDVADLV